MDSKASETAHFRLLVLGDGSVRTISLHGSRWFVGRAADSSVPLRDPTVSRKHLVIERRGDDFHFQDLGGSNPVLLDGRPTKQGQVLVGQTLAIGLTRLVLEQRATPSPLATTGQPTVVLSREVADDEVSSTAPTQSFAATATRVLDRIEWTFADLGDLTHAAEPLLDLALNLTGRRLGWIGRFNPQGQPEPLASLDTTGAGRTTTVPTHLLAEARRLLRPHLLKTQEDAGQRERLMIPLGDHGQGLLVLEDPHSEAASSQELLRLGHSLSMVVWHRLQETTERLRLRDELQRLRFHGTAAHNALLASTRLQEARLALRTFSGSGEPVLLLGEDGTEIEDLARYLHAESPRRAQAFVPWNAARVPEWRHERDLFGDGRDHVGELHRANGGTLFLDRIDRIAPALLQRLAVALRRPDASNPPPALVAATNLTLANLPETSPLHFLPHQRIEVPPLRDHARDVLALAELFLSELGNGPDGAPRLLTERAKRLLAAYGWPGNVRELRLVIESAAALAAGLPIAPRHLPPAIANDAGASSPDVPTLEEVERLHIIDVMQRVGGNRSRAAQALGIATSTLYEKLKRYQIND